jgi:[ribosomal protein S5]-alanine N-acetyltransferase
MQKLDLINLVLPEPVGEFRLRWWELKDVQCVFAAACEYLITLDNSIHSECHELQALAWIGRQNNKIMEGTDLPLCIALTSTDEAVGMVGVFGLNKTDATSARCGYWITPKMRGHKFSAKALELVSSWAFGALPLQTLELAIDPSNLASIRTAEIAGYFLESTLTSRIEIGGTLRDMLLFIRRRAVPFPS